MFLWNFEQTTVIPPIKFDTDEYTISCLMASSVHSELMTLPIVDDETTWKIHSRRNPLTPKTVTPYQLHAMYHAADLRKKTQPNRNTPASFCLGLHGQTALPRLRTDADAVGERRAGVWDVLRGRVQRADDADVDGIAAAGLGEGVVARVKVLAFLEMAGEVARGRRRPAVEAEDAQLFGRKGLLCMLAFALRTCHHPFYKICGRCKCGREEGDLRSGRRRVVRWAASSLFRRQTLNG